MPKKLLSLGCLALHLIAGCADAEPQAKSPSQPPADLAKDGEAMSKEESWFAAPAKSDQRLAMAASPGAPPPPPPPPPPGTPAPAGQPPAPQGTAASEAAALRAPMLIYTAQITMAVFEVNVSLSRV